MTIRRRGATILRRLADLPASPWTKAAIDTPKRSHQQIRYLQETLRLRGYEGPIRQIAVAGLGRDQPTLLITNHFLSGYEKAAPKQLYRRFLETSGRVEIQEDRLVVYFDKGSHNPILREAALDRAQTPIPWLNDLPVVFTFP